jgi:GT2 family glycosyltransferase
MGSSWLRHGQGGQIALVIRSVLDTAPEGVEVIVIDDGSDPYVMRCLRGMLSGADHFILRCNDLFEIRTYNRAIAMSRGQFVALLQDDDIYSSQQWWRDALRIFEANPRVGVCGGYAGADLGMPEPVPVHQSPMEHYRQHPDRTEGDQYSWPGIASYTLVRGTDLAAPVFVDQVNRAPMFVRRECFDDVGPFDESFAPFQCDDKEFCIRAWKAGWQVALYSSGAQMHCFEGGMRRLELERRITLSYRNHQRLYELHGDFISSGGHVALTWGRGGPVW